MDYATIKYIQQKILKPKIESYTEKVIIGVDNFEEYKYITGQIRSLKDLQQNLGFPGKDLIPELQELQPVLNPLPSSRCESQDQLQ